MFRSVLGPAWKLLKCFQECQSSALLLRKLDMLNKSSYHVQVETHNMKMILALS